jgi:cytidylate kinase
MKAGVGLEQCFAYVTCHLQPPARPAGARRQGERPPAVTISRQTGAGAHAVAEKLAAYLQTRGPKDEVPWTVFDRELVEKVLEEHNLPQELARYMPEDRVSRIDDMMEELLGLHPPSSILVRQTTETVLHLAELGRVILLGRGANVITRKLPNVFHVRLVAPLPKRVAYLQEVQHLSRRAAEQFVAREDRGRARYLRRYFDADIDDPLLYDLTLNTERITFDEAARQIGDALIARHKLAR